MCCYCTNEEEKNAKVSQEEPFIPKYEILQFKQESTHLIFSTSLCAAFAWSRKGWSWIIWS